MAGWRTAGRRAAEFLRSLSDLVAVVGYVAFALGVTAVFDHPMLARLLGLPILLFAPGYALVSALFPEGRSDDEADDDADFPGGLLRTQRADLTLLERGVLSLGFSLVAVSLVVLFVTVSPLPLGRVSVVAAVVLFTLAATVAAGYRRAKVPPVVRFEVSLGRWREGLRTDRETTVGVALNVLLVVGVVVAVASVSYALVEPKERASYTTLAVLGEDENGSLVAGHYPTEFARDESRSVHVEVSNRERRPMEYVVVAQLQRVASNGNDTTVVERERLGRRSVRVGESRNRTIAYEVRPSMTGRDLRLVFLLYVGDVPANPTISNAYREVHLWVTVSNRS